MTKHPQLQKFIAAIKGLRKRKIAFRYLDGHTVVLSVSMNKITVECTNPLLTLSIGNLLTQTLQGKPVDKSKRID